jgi:MtN3 and saliva related transmembrane protein
MFLDIIGFIASVTSVIGFVPQIIKIKQTRSTQNISFLMLLNFFICSVTWVIYGYYTNVFYVTLTNIISSIFCIILIFQIFYYRCE